MLCKLHSKNIMYSEQYEESKLSSIKNTLSYLMQNDTNVKISEPLSRNSE